MNPFTRLFRSTSRKSFKNPRPPNRLRARLSVERLETRLMPANVFVVPLGQPTDAFHYYSLADAVPFAGTGGVVTIEPGASPSFPPFGRINFDGITIQGDPNVPASILPSLDFGVTGDNVKLVNLNLGSLTLGVQGLATEPKGARVSNCLINNVTGYANDSFLFQNTITGSASFLNNQIDILLNNTFASTAGNEMVNINSCSTVNVSQNTFNGDSSTGILVVNSNGVYIANNKITLSGPSNAYGIFVEQQGNPTCSVTVLNNSISTSNAGTGLRLIGDNGTAVQATVQGNDFHNNAVGVQIIGDLNNDLGNIDLGGGAGGAGSLGGNNFRGFQGGATLTSAAISIFNGRNGIGGTGNPIPAEQNMFRTGVPPTQEIFLDPTNGGTIAVDQELSDQRSYVQVLYQDLLGRTGTLAELDGWVSILNGQGQTPVVNGILRSSESLGRIVDSLYLRFLGRQSDSAGRAGWINALQHGATLEAIETAFLTAPEYLHHINTDFVQSLYLNILGRTGGATELSFWDNQVQSIGLAGVANGFVLSQEYRNDNVIADFQSFLHRPPKASEVAAFAASPGDLLTLEGSILDTQEDFING